MTPPHILYVEDDESLGFVTRDNLELNGYRITHHKDGAAALAAIRTESYDLCVLDVMLPEVDGFTLAEAIRAKDREVPIIFLSAKSLKEDRLHGLKIGADDYLTKPFSIEELLLKIQIFLRRSSIVPIAVPVQHTLGTFTFDYENLQLQHADSTRTLTQREADLLHYFAQHPNRVLKRSDILLQVWGEDDYFLGRSLDVFISRLRKYLRPDAQLRIENIHGVGFKLLVP